MAGGSKVVFRGADGRTLTLDDLRGITGTFRYEVVGDFNVPAEAKALHHQARLAGQSRDFKKAWQQTPTAKRRVFCRLTGPRSCGGKGIVKVRYVY